jgi:CRP-like cAMP-binding protein
MQNIKAYFEKFVDINDFIWSLFTKKLESKTYPKGTILLKIGEVENYVSVIEEGAVRFVIPGEESETTFGFAFEGHFFSAYDSFVFQKPSQYQIETLTEVKVWSISHQDLNDLFDNTREGNLVGRQIAEQFFCGKQNRELSLLTKTATERYYNLFKNQPKLIKEIPLKYIASYIGITPQALSRIRAELS